MNAYLSDWKNSKSLIVPTVSEAVEKQVLS